MSESSATVDFLCSASGIEPSGDGWEGDAVAYPWVFDDDGTRYLLYNGEGFGRGGFGVACAVV